MGFNITGEVFQNVLYLLIGAMLAALAGIWAGWIESSRKNKNDIKKIKSLLNSDFSRINDLAIENLESIEKELKKFDIEDDPYEIKDKEIKDLFERKLELDDYLINFHYEYEFNFWTALVSSGSLIKLKEVEIEVVQTAYDLTSDANKEIMEFRVGLKDRLYKFTTAFSTKPKSFKINLKKELESMHDYAESIYETVQDLNEFQWMKLKKRKN